MRARFLFTLALIISSITQAQAQEVAISAFNPEVISTYSQSDEFLAGLKNLKPKIAAMCADLLSAQLRLQQEKDTWKMYSLYEMFEKQALMTSQLQRVGTVTELAGVIPKYTNYRLNKEPLPEVTKLKSGSLLIADKGSPCGPDLLAPRKGAYFLKCGDYLIGSGLVKVHNLNLKKCLNVRMLQNRSL